MGKWGTGFLRCLCFGVRFARSARNRPSENRISISEAPADCVLLERTLLGFMSSINSFYIWRKFFLLVLNFRKNCKHNPTFWNSSNKAFKILVKLGFIMHFSLEFWTGKNFLKLCPHLVHTTSYILTRRSEKDKKCFFFF